MSLGDLQSASPSKKKSPGEGVVVVTRGRSPLANGGGSPHKKKKIAAQFHEHAGFFNRGEETRPSDSIV